MRIGFIDMPTESNAREPRPKMSTDDELRELVRSHGGAVDRYLRSIERSPEAREEHWADVFTVAFERLEDLRGLSEGRARAWLLTTARNIVRNVARRETTRRDLLHRLAAEPASLERSAEDRYLDSVVDTDRLGSVWDELRPSHRQVLYLAMEGLDGPGISEQMGITHQAARSLLMRARGAFLDRYQRCGATG